MTRTPASAVVLERDEALDAVRGAVAAAAVGAGHVLVLDGESGSGKSLLLAEAQRLAVEAGVRVLSARGGRLERNVAFGVARQLFEAELRTADSTRRATLLADAAALTVDALSVTGRAARPAGLEAVLHGFYWLTANLADERPLLLVIDDAHWADPESLQVLSYVGRRIDSLAASILLSTRAGTVAPGDLMAVIHAETATDVVRLRPLSLAAATALAKHLLPYDADPAFVAACFTATGGNPFLLRQLLLTAAQEPATPTGADAERVLQRAARALRRPVLSRLAGQGSDVIELAQAVAVLAIGAPLADAAAVAGLSVQQAEVAADDLRRAGVLDASPSLEFAHPLVRNAIYEQLPAGVRSRAHRRAAATIDARAAAPEHVAAHLLQVEPAGDAWVLERLRAAATAAIATGANDSAAGLLRRALAEPPTPAERGAVLLDLGRACMGVDPPAAITALRECCSIAGTALLPAAASALARALQLTQQPGEAVAVLDEAAARLIEADGDPAAAARLRAEAVSAAWFSEHGQRPAWRGRLAALGDVSGESPLERRLLIQQILADHYQTSAPRMLALARKVLEQTGPEDGPTTGAVGEFMLPLMLANGEAYDEAQQVLQHWLAQARAMGAVPIAISALALQATTQYRLGRLRDAEADADAAWQLVREHGPHRGMSWWMAVATLVRVLVARGRTEAALRVIADAGLEGDLPRVPVVPLIAEVRAELWLATGRTEEAVEELLAVGAWSGRPFSLADALWESLAVDGLLATGRRKEAHSLAMEAVSAARAYDAPLPLGRALRALGLASGGEQGLSLLAESTDVLAASSGRAEHARSLAEHGAALRRAGRRRAAVAALRDALDLATRCGADALAARAREELAVLGSRPQAPVLTGLTALTASERRVVQLAAQGLSNPQIAQALFVSRKTVEAHLGRAYPKLGITSRDELAGVLAGEL